MEPDPNFARRSLALILNTPQSSTSIFSRKFFDLIKFSAALGLATLLMVVVFGGLSILKTLSPTSLTSLDTDSLNKEISNMNISIQLSSNARYYDESIDKITMALTNTAQNGPNHLNPSVIQNELQKLDDLKSSNKTLDDILNDLVL
ncbi:MAG: hypothetical protein Athens071426_358 [Parcubacteria group bacterium Athens0714_26]|nr:MAG: hypothetical protein Athens101426_142 [Parcubacteria group bacterium Athens1014_26]TSD02938.1 MAG: hypothetical protein Athens071426_358 [Parcubacteria group bacterium Athens0714_26]